MKQLLIAILASVFFFLFVLSFVILRDKRITDLESAYLVQPIQQDANERVWKNFNFEVIGASTEFISSSHMRFDEKGYIYVADNDDKTIKRFDVYGDLSKTYGKGEGRGPGEFLTIIDLHISEKNTLWIVDDRNNRVTIYDTENQEKWNILNLDYAFNKILPIGTDYYWAEKKFNNQMEIYQNSGQLIGKVDPIVNDPRLWSYVLEGFYALVPNGGVVQSQYHTNKIVGYSKNGEVIFFREPIEFLGLPEIDPHYANDVAKINTVDFSSWLQVTSDPHVNDNFLYVFVKKKDGRTNEWGAGFIDVYDLNAGDYQYSFKLPESLEAMAVSDAYIAGISEELGRLMIWKLNEK